MRRARVAATRAAADHRAAGNDAAAGGAVATRTRRARTRGQRRPETRARARHQRRRLAILRLGLLEALVRHFDPLLQIVEYRVAEDFPPRAALDRVARPCLLPAGLPRLSAFLVDGRRRQLRLPVVGTDGAGAQRGAQRNGWNIQSDGFHFFHLYTFCPHLHDRLRRRARRRAINAQPLALAPQAKTVEVQIHDRRGVQASATG